MSNKEWLQYHDFVLQRFPSHDPEIVFEVLREINNKQRNGASYTGAVKQILQEIKDSPSKANNQKGMARARALFTILTDVGIDPRNAFDTPANQLEATP